MERFAYLSQETTLMYPDFTRAFHVLFRCFYPGHWGMLVQYDGNDEHVVAFCARKLQVLRSTTLPLNRVMGIIFCFMQWRCYLEGPQVICILTMNP
jgi:hypothetical protein